MQCKMRTNKILTSGLLVLLFYLFFAFVCLFLFLFFFGTVASQLNHSVMYHSFFFCFVIRFSNRFHRIAGLCKI